MTHSVLSLICLHICLFPCMQSKMPCCVALHTCCRGSGHCISSKNLSVPVHVHHNHCRHSQRGVELSPYLPFLVKAVVNGGAVQTSDKRALGLLGLGWAPWLLKGKHT
jgi:hypothetical protein